MTRRAEQRRTFDISKIADELEQAAAELTFTTFATEKVLQESQAEEHFSSGFYFTQFKIINQIRRIAESVTAHAGGVA
jgi:hypothetical protein